MAILRLAGVRQKYRAQLTFCKYEENPESFSKQQKLKADWNLWESSDEESIKYRVPVLLSLNQMHSPYEIIYIVRYVTGH